VIQDTLLALRNLLRYVREHPVLESVLADAGLILHIVAEAEPAQRHLAILWRADAGTG
jgi:hypothetical protein